MQRKIDKRGRVYYVGTGAPSYSKKARKAYIKQFSTKQELATDKLRYKDLTKGEKLSFQASNRLRDEKGKVLSREKANAVRYAFGASEEKASQENLNEIYKTMTLNDFLKDQEYQELSVVDTQVKLKAYVIGLNEKDIELTPEAEKVFKYVIDQSGINRVEFQTNIKEGKASFKNFKLYLTSNEVVNFTESGKPILDDGAEQQM